MNDALITPEEREKSLTQAAEQKIAPEIIATAAAIWRASEGTISKEAAIRAAFHFQTTGEVLGRDSYVGTKGSAKGQVIEGYRAVLRNIRQPYQTRFRPMNRDEFVLHELADGDLGLVCELDLLNMRRECITHGIPYAPILGITVLRKGEKLQVPATKTRYWVLQKQARDDAFRQIPGAGLDDEAAALARNITVPEGARLDETQAAALVATSEMVVKNTRETALLSPDAVIVRGQRNIDIMRGPQTEDPLGIDTPPSPDRTAAAAIADAEFAAIPAAPNSIYAIPTSDSAQTNESVPRRKPAAISGGLVGSFTLWAEEFAKTHARWQRDGRPDRMHLLLSIAKLGHPKITPENWEQVQMEMADHAAMPSQPALLNSATHGESS